MFFPPVWLLSCLKQSVLAHQRIGILLIKQVLWVATIVKLADLMSFWLQI